MSLITIVVVVLAVLVIAGLPQWPYARPYAWGYYPSAVFGLVLIVLLAALALGYRF
jgi:hypothetical protein